MKPPRSEWQGTARAAISAYLVLCGPWLLLSAGFGLLAIYRGAEELVSPTLLFGFIAAAWAAWLRGFCIHFSSTAFRYRDGLYRVTEAPIDGIEGVESRWVQWKLTGAAIRIPRVAVLLNKGDVLLINPKPFERKRFQAIVSQLRRVEDRGAEDEEPKTSRGAEDVRS